MVADTAPFTSPSLVAHPLRSLATDPALHPRGQSHLSAASGLVCLGGRAYVIADDEHHLAVFRDQHAFGELHRVLPGDLPESKGARKKRKPDFETLLLLSAPGALPTATLVALGSGSRPNRCAGSLIALGIDGRPSNHVRHFDLMPLYEPLAASIGALNIEGAMMIGDEVVLLNRGIAHETVNAVVRYRRSDFLELIDGQKPNARTKIKPTSILPFPLAPIDGVSLGFTDGAALPDGRWTFSAVAENSPDRYLDGPCVGSAIGLVSADGDLIALHRLDPPVKVEGIDARLDSLGIAMCLVTDTDDPAISSWLYQARIEQPPAPRPR